MKDSLKDIKELIWFLDKHKLKNIKVITNKSKSGITNRYRTMYELLKDNPTLSEDDIALHFGYENSSVSSYRKFRKEFKNRLHNTLLFVTLEDERFNEMQRYFQICHEKNAVINILVSKSARFSAIDIIKEYLDIAIKYEFNEICYNWIKILRNTAAVEGNEKEYWHWSAMFTKYENLIIWENKALHYKEIVSLPQVNTLSIRQGLTEQSKKFYEELSPMIDVIDSSRFLLHLSAIDIYQYTTIFDWQQTLNVTEKWFNILQKRSGTTQSMLGRMTLYKAVSLTMLGSYRAAHEEFLKMEIAHQKFGFQGVMTRQYFHAYNSLLSGEYAIAWQQLTELLQDDKFTIFYPIYQELTKIAYSFLVIIRRLDFFRIEQHENITFIVDNFINQKVVFAQDKKGVYTSILVLQIFLLLSEQSFDAAVEKITLLNRYKGRHFDENNDSYRFQLFVHLIGLLRSYNFQLYTVEKKAVPYLEKLKVAPLKDQEQNHCVEVIRYEQLWQMMVNAVRGEYQQRMKRIRLLEKKRTKKGKIVLYENFNELIMYEKRSFGE